MVIVNKTDFAKLKSDMESAKKVPPALDNSYHFCKRIIKEIGYNYTDCNFEIFIHRGDLKLVVGQLEVN